MQRQRKPYLKCHPSTILGDSARNMIFKEISSPIWSGIWRGVWICSTPIWGHGWWVNLGAFWHMHLEFRHIWRYMQQRVKSVIPDDFLNICKWHGWRSYNMRYFHMSRKKFLLPDMRDYLNITLDFTGYIMRAPSERRVRDENTTTLLLQHPFHPCGYFINSQLIPLSCELMQ